MIILLLQYSCIVLAFVYMLYKIGYGHLLFRTVRNLYLKRQFQYWKSRGIPHNEPPIGNVYGNAEEVGKTVHIAQFTKSLYDQFKKTGAKLCGVYFGPNPVAIPIDFELVKRILNQDFHYFNDRGLYYNDVDDPLTANLFTLDFKKWQPLRESGTVAFKPLQIKLMFPKILRIAEEFCECLHEELENEVEMRDFLARFTTDIIGTCVFGIEANSLRNPNAEFRMYGRKLFEEPRYGMFVRRILDETPRFCRLLSIKKIPDDIAAFFMRVIHETVEHREMNNVKQNDIMDLLIRTKNENKRMTGEKKAFNQLAAQAFVFFQAGFESSASTLGFCLYELALNKNIQDKARKFIRENFQKYGGEFTYEMMEDMSYIDKIIKETLRKYPPASYMPRVCQKDYLIPETNYTIEKGTKIYIPVHAIHHDPEIYPDPDTFNADRKEDVKTFLGFGLGPRNCIGMRFAMVQAKIGLIALLNNFEFSLGESATVPIAINEKIALLTPVNVYLKLSPI